MGRDGLPALPALALGFLVPNADLLWRRFDAHAEARRRSSSETALDVRRVREHVDRPRAHELVAVLLAQRFTSPASVVGLHET